ncbi:hypothetical protein [Mucilaginibacter sp.]|uniref:hypothetical protein n=1 Tax=Mucilaginibacter sp. TaxID=1882438 RepID=UPI0025CFE9C9|nr:hypothetical protein [Mucilaginibacter sp.]
MKSDVPTNNETYKFKTHKSYSVEEVLAAGGATAFGLKTGKTGQKLIEALKNTPKIDPFTDEEWEDLQRQVANDR